MAEDATTSTSSAAAYLPPALPASRHDIQAAVAKAAELRALHAALLQGGANAGAYASASRSPSVIRLPPAASPALARTSLALAAASAGAEDYPVFAPVSGPTSNWRCALLCTVSWYSTVIGARACVKGGSFGAGFACSASPC